VQGLRVDQGARSVRVRRLQGTEQGALPMSAANRGTASAVSHPSYFIDTVLADKESLLFDRNDPGWTRCACPCGCRRGFWRNGQASCSSCEHAARMGWICPDPAVPAPLERQRLRKQRRV
jgi:hypothetical protein